MPSLKKIPLLLLAAIVIVSPFFRGLFFPQDFLWFAFLVGLLGGLSACLCAPKPISVIESALFALAGWYLAMLPWAASKGDAVIGAVRMLSSASVYYSARRILTPQMLKPAGGILSGLMTALVFFGISSASGFPQIKDSWQNGLSSFFQYHNALGGYLLIGIPISIWLYEECAATWHKMLVLSAIYFEFLGLAGTQSRGAWICFGVTLAMIVPALRSRLITGVAIALALWAAVVDWGLVAWAKQWHSELVGICPLAGLAIVPAIVWIRARIESRTPHRTTMPWLALTVLILIAGTIPLFSPTANGDLDLLRRAQKVSVHETTWLLRSAYYKDAVRMGVARPITGFGGGGWSDAFRAYQSTFYRSKNVHSEPLEIFVETGFPGLLLYSAFWIGFLWAWVKTWKHRRERSDFLLGIAGVGILLHSLIDFDLSESAIFFTTIAVLAGWQNLNDKNSQQASDTQGTSFKWLKQLSKVGSISTLATAIVLILVSPVLALGIHYAALAPVAFRAGDVDKALGYYQSALRYFPFQADTRADLSWLQTREGLHLSDTNQVHAAMRNIRKAMAHDSMNPVIRKIAVRIYAAAGYNEDAYAQTLEMVRLGPLYSSSYESVATYGLKCVQDLLKAGDSKKAAQVLNRIIQLPREIEVRLRTISPGPGLSNDNEPPLRVSKQLQEDVGRAEKLRAGVQPG